ncbi:sigma-70 family RNA polymerase sigma factor [Umezawaea endophytica]|uniref:Sigma-70 family RNA polymerase sigma factor n=1 Tax=Umezawaea endophytica TaxID=1654476 RepID=A0A9X3A3V1_9PSEU|nr:sigma-70 family RNA polymerase sigma factor [Umezawaea endophytica]MCS7482129.1 sigma-70 family RNA polymerase sigma factor [Umezawaea endophytica]
MAEYIDGTDGTEVDRDLLARVRAGEDAAYGELFSRHADAVRRFSLRHVREPAEADDLTAEAFFRVLQAIRRGTGPTDHVRTYLLTVARRVAWEWSGRRRDVPVDDEELSRRVEPYADATANRAEYTLIGRAFTSLPERWRTVLWQVEVEGERPSAVAPLFGLSANAMSALARRAREGLRAAYLQAHLAEDHGEESCASVLVKLGSFTAGGVQGAEQRRIRKHLRTCARCTALHVELTEVCSALRAHAAHLGVPVAVTALVGAQVVPVAVAGKAAWLGGRVKFVLAGAASAAAVGVFSLLAGLFTGSPGPGVIRADQDAPHGLQLVITTSDTTTSSLPPSAITELPGTEEDERPVRQHEVAAPPPVRHHVDSASDHVQDSHVSRTGQPDLPPGEGDEQAVEEVFESGDVTEQKTSESGATTSVVPSRSLASSSSTAASSGSPTPTTVIIRPTSTPPPIPTYGTAYRAE